MDAEVLLPAVQGAPGAERGPVRGDDDAAAGGLGGPHPPAPGADSPGPLDGEPQLPPALGRCAPLCLSHNNTSKGLVPTCKLQSQA